MRKVAGRVFLERSCPRLEATLLQKPVKFPQELHPEIVIYHFRLWFMTVVGDAGA
jgi:hypothetical protein